MLVKTKILKNNIKNIILAAKFLKNNEVLGLPTETVYGLGGRADNEIVIKKIFSIKNRPFYNPLILHYKNTETAISDIYADDRVFELAKNFWPGPLTIVSNIKNKSISKTATANSKTVAVRVPSNRVFNKLLMHLNFPLAAPSANRYGKISPTSARDVYEELKDKIPAILDGGPSAIGVESTVVDLSSSKTKILRHGYISTLKIESVLNCKITEKNNTKQFKSPGLDLNHYQPDTPVRINARKQKFNEAWLAFGEIPNNFHKPCISLSKKKCLKEAARNLYKMLRLLDKKNIGAIAVQKIPEKGIGIALNDRLLRAAKNNKRYV